MLFMLVGVVVWFWVDGRCFGCGWRCNRIYSFGGCVWCVKVRLSNGCWVIFGRCNRSDIGVIWFIFFEWCIGRLL